MRCNSECSGCFEYFECLLNEFVEGWMVFDGVFDGVFVDCYGECLVSSARRGLLVVSGVVVW